MITGNVKYLTKQHIKKLEEIKKRRIPSYQIVSQQVLNTISKISREISKQIGVIIDRSGKIRMIVVGDEREILWPSMLEFRLNRFSFREIRAVHTHLNNEGLGIDDLTDMAYLRLDAIASVNVDENSKPVNIEIATYKINGEELEPHIIFKGPFHKVDFDFLSKIKNIENSIDTAFLKKTESIEKKVILVNVGIKKSKFEMEDELEELENLAKSAGFKVDKKIIQRVNKINPSYVLGKGKFKELIITSLNRKVDKIIFYNDLTPAQVKAIAKTVDVEVIDRTVLILNIFAKRAISREGKLKVEYAKLKYLLPRVADKQEALSRIRGGIGLRGPGETKAEVERRKIKERIKKIEEELLKIRKSREVQRKKITKNHIPVVSIVGYTNAGKSTLLSTLTGAEVFIENLLFATLDTFKRKYKLPDGRDIIITDTVGFIKNLPKDLLDAFMSTLEELNYSDLIIHLVDISDKNFETHIKITNEILDKIGVKANRILVFNKIDRLENEIVENLCYRYGAIGISAKDKNSVISLIELISNNI